MSPGLQDRLKTAQRVLVSVGLVALACSVIGVWIEPRQFFFSYLYGYLFWLGLSILGFFHELQDARYG